tara:strand:- start:786 stop:1697 length:912 start_codon:yes stop_codon:yes gene_type:complete
MVKNKNLPTIVFFVYNRADHLKKTILSLKKNKQYRNYDIVIFGDGPKNKLDKIEIEKVKLEVENINGFKSKKMFFSFKNKGLAKSVVDGINKVFKMKNIESIIVLEDDLNFNKYFLDYMSKALYNYKDNKNIGSVTGYSFFKKDPRYKDNLYLSPRHSSWGWGTWKNQWKKFIWKRNWVKEKFKKKKIREKINMGGKDLSIMLKQQIDYKIDSWSIIFDLNCSINGLYCVCPKKSLVENTGLDNSGTHCKNDISLNLNFDKNYQVKKFPKLEVDTNIIKDVQRLFEVSISQKIKNKFKQIIKI